MHIHILGICGTFMGGIASIAKAAGHTVSGSDSHVYPPMSDQLRALGITLYERDDLAQFSQHPDCVIIGNALSRGQPAVEWVLNSGIAYTSGPQWLAEHVLHDRHVLAVSGTHGKTTTTAMLTHILRESGLNPGYLVGGVVPNLEQTAFLGQDYFVIEADEYDTAFFDKRSKFLHYRPSTLIINNLEFDHADIFKDLEAIQTSFQRLLRTVPSTGVVIYPAGVPAIDAVIDRGCWSTQVCLNDAAGWEAELVAKDGSHFQVKQQGNTQGEVCWGLVGQHNTANGMAAIAAAQCVDIDAKQACNALSSFKGVKRRLECLGEVNGIAIYDDFAHHPTAIKTTLTGLRSHISQGRIIAVLELGSNTMKSGYHGSEIGEALALADEAVVLGVANIDMAAVTSVSPHISCQPSVAAIIQQVCEIAKQADHVVIMSNTGFGGLHNKLLVALSA